MSSKQPTEQKPCFFLKIAGELRNRIYREVLLQPAPIDYGDKGYIRPALLNTCKAIRSEALKIYYYENSFHTDVWAYNASGMYRFRTSLEPIGVNYEKIEEMTTTCFDLASWSNLMEWLRQYHADLNDWRITYKEEEDEDYDRARLQEALSQMFDVVEGLGGMEWEQVEQEMGVLRWDLTMMDEDWGDAEEDSKDGSEEEDEGEDDDDDDDDDDDPEQGSSDNEG